MNKKSGLILRLVAGLYLIYLGIQLIIQLQEQQPSNYALMMCAAALFIAVGLAYAVYTVRKIWKMVYKPKQKEDSLDGLQMIDIEDRGTVRRGNIGDVDLKGDGKEEANEKSKEEVKGEAEGEETLRYTSGQEKELEKESEKAEPVSSDKREELGKDSTLTELHVQKAGSTEPDGEREAAGAKKEAPDAKSKVPGAKSKVSDAENKGAGTKKKESGTKNKESGTEIPADSTGNKEDRMV